MRRLPLRPGEWLVDVAILLARMTALRTETDCAAFAAALKNATQPSLPLFSSDEVGRIHAADSRSLSQSVSQAKGCIK